jgi:uncharacterized protein YegJ (DUF2314 family)
MSLLPAARSTAPGVALLRACCWAFGTSAQSISEKADRDEIIRIHSSDPQMAAAMRKARASLQAFLALARAPRPTITSLALKVAIREGEIAEYFWITHFKEAGGHFTGRISNTPRSVKSVKQGQDIQFSEKEIVDWLYREGGKMYGNYTACALADREPKEQAAEFKARYGLNCE